MSHLTDLATAIANAERMAIELATILVSGTQPEIFEKQRQAQLALVTALNAILAEFKAQGVQ